MKSTRAFLVAALLIVAGAACGSDQDLAERQEAVAEAGAEVMPFSLDETTHIFTDTPGGGRQDVVADDPTDVVSIEAIRDHLAEEAAKFQTGDFSDPETIHGSAMPGLATLKAGFDQIDVELLETADGAAITYTTQDPELISAIHLWFEAQTSDHGSHAEHNR
ncbi:MAG: aspartate carbamoyltransferase [Acidimicrobiia bacterium]|nr:aspartate carbamoyltransferase [Acidimicrobiia bacterium]